ncbi:MAG: AsmA-like C-terminal region-containing protein [Muribaculaceae bacterium]
MADDNSSIKEEAKNRNPLITVLKVLGWTLLALFLIVIIVCSLIVWILTPAKLTPIVEEYATEYLNAEVKVERVELSFWSTFPHLSVDVEDVLVVSHSLDSVPDNLRAALPENADTLLSLGLFSGRVNVPALGVGKISLYDVKIESPRINLVKVNEEYTNYDIVPAGESVEDASGETSIPDISINQFVISDAEPIRYRSLSDSLDVAIGIKNIVLNGEDAPCYSLDVKANGRTPMLGVINLDEIAVSVNGAIDWNRKRPNVVTFNDFNVKVDSLCADISASVEFADSLKINELTCNLPEWDVNYLLKRIPAEYAPALKGLDTDMKLSVTARLKKPYAIGDSIAVLPTLTGEIEIPACHVRRGDLQFNKLLLEAEYAFDGDNIDNTTIEVSRFVVDGKAMDIDLNAKVRTPISDPAIDGKLNAKFDIDKMPKMLFEKFARYITGKIDASLQLNMRMSDLNPNRFHRLKIDGDIDLTGFRYISLDSATDVYARNSCLKFGTNRKIENEVRTVDSLLTATVEVDTAHVVYESMTIDVNGFKTGLGTRVTREKLDSTMIVPFGGTLSFKRLKMFDSVDSLRFRVRDIRAIASLKRFEGDSHVPQLSLAIDTRSLSAGIKRELGIGLKKGHFDITSNLRKKRQKSATDSTATRRRKASRNIERDVDDLDMSVDSGLKAIIRNWDIKGSMKAESGRFYTYAMPVRNRLKNIDVTFNLDSIVMRNLDYQMGESGFVINGSIANLRRVLLGRKRNNALKIDFDVIADTVNINEISRLLFTETTGSGDAMADLEKLESGELDNTAAADTGAMTAFMVPGNIDADIRVQAANVIYTDMMLHDFRCQLLMRNKVANIRDLSARAELGELNLSALYSTMERDSIQFGMGLKIDRFRLDKMSKIVPAIDTLMPMLQSFSGIVNADIAATTQIDSAMNFVMPSLQAAIKLSGDSLVLLDPDTFKMLSKWLIFKNKEKNMIDHMTVEMVVEDNQLQIFPFLFDIDRYRLGVMGTNDLAMNLNYHISVLKSPLPFKFGINIKGNVDDMKIRLGGAKFKENAKMATVSIADTTRINLINEIENVFRRSAHSPIRLNTKNNVNTQMNGEEKISHEDSLLMIKQGYIEAPAIPDTINAKQTTTPTGNK